MTRAELESHLMPIALEVAKPMTFSPQCEDDLRHLIRKSAAQVTPDSLDDAVQNLEDLVRAMRTAAHNEILEEQTLRQALEWLCPLFPFC